MSILPAALVFLLAAPSSGTAAPPSSGTAVPASSLGSSGAVSASSGTAASGTAAPPSSGTAVPASSLGSSGTVSPVSRSSGTELPTLRARGPDPKDLDSGLGGHPAGGERAVWASGLLLGLPYVLSPLGEGAGIDPDPRFRLDAFDCVTLVETAMALGSSSSVAEAQARLDDIRYDGAPDFQHRNHYLEAQWLPVNVRKGYVRDVTEEIGGDLAMRGDLRLSSGTWRAAERAGRVVAGLEPGHRPLGTFALPFVPIDHLAELAARIPPGTILLVVREARPWRPYRVTHLGIVVTAPDGTRLLRHASDVPGVMRVRDEPLLRFAARNARLRGWPVVGASLWAIQDASARAVPEAAPR